MLSDILRQCVVIFALCAAGAVYTLVSGLAPRPWIAPELAPGEIRVSDARVLDAIWVDTRTIEAYEAGHIPDALFLSEDAWESGLFELMDLWLTAPRPIFVYCDTEQCGTSERIAARLREAVPEMEVYSLRGGWAAWQQ